MRKLIFDTTKNKLINSSQRALSLREILRHQKQESFKDRSAFGLNVLGRSCVYQINISNLSQLRGLALNEAQRAEMSHRSGSLSAKPLSGKGRSKLSSHGCRFLLRRLPFLRKQVMTALFLFGILGDKKFLHFGTGYCNQVATCSMPHFNSVPQSQWSTSYMGSTVRSVGNKKRRKEQSLPLRGFLCICGERVLYTDD